MINIRLPIWISINTTMTTYNLKFCKYPPDKIVTHL